MATSDANSSQLTIHLNWSHMTLFVGALVTTLTMLFSAAVWVIHNTIDGHGRYLDTIEGMIQTQGTAGIERSKKLDEIVESLDDLNNRIDDDEENLAQLQSKMDMYYPLLMKTINEYHPEILNDIRPAMGEE